jgi:hypothetical protein
MNARPLIRKLGTIDCDMVETTPVVWGGRLLRFEYVRHPWYKPNKTGDTYFRFVDVETGECGPPFAHGYHFGSAYVEGDTMYVFGVQQQAGLEMTVFWSRDLTSWQSQVAFRTDGWTLFNNSVCKGPDGYVMAFELGEPPEIVGVRFTNRFAASKDLLDWEILPAECVFTLDRYSACPVIKYVEPHYYMIYLEYYQPFTFRPHMVRSEDLITWEASPFNPILDPSDEDKVIANPAIPQEERERIAGIININNSDVDLCEFQGKTVIYYSWGTQTGNEFLALAEYDGPMDEFFTSHFPEEMQ